MNRDSRRKKKKTKNRGKKILTAMLVMLAAVFLVFAGILTRTEQKRLKTEASPLTSGSEESLFEGEESDEASEPVGSTEDGDDGTSAETNSTASEDSIQNVNLVPGETEEDADEIEQQISEMTLEEKVDQLFIVTPDQLTGVSDTVTVGSVFQKAIGKYPVGGFIFFENNLESPDQTKEFLSDLQSFYEQNGFPDPILSVDEEGGTVARIANNPSFGVTNVGSMKEIGASGDPNRAAEAGDTIGSYLSELGFNTDFAPVADVLTNPDNTVIGRRSFGSDPALVTSMVEAECTALLQRDICPVLKHFPGHGATEGDTHEGYAYTSKTLDELMQAELVPFENAGAYAPMIMAAHISLPGVTGDDTPASLSKTMITDILREKLGYGGVVITDALNMEAIVNEYGSDAAAVKAVEAGCDLLLMPMSFSKAREGILNALRDGTLTEERINESIRRILRLKEE